MGRVVEVSLQENSNTSFLAHFGLHWKYVSSFPLLISTTFNDLITLCNMSDNLILSQYLKVVGICQYHSVTCGTQEMAHYIQRN